MSPALAVNLATLGLIIIILVVNLITESAILRRTGKDMTKIGSMLKSLAIMFGVLGVVFFGAGAWFAFHPNRYAPTILLSLSAMLISPAPMLAIKGHRLTETQPEKLIKLGNRLSYCVKWLIALSIVLLVTALVVAIIKL
jgi:hypothetical protein